MKKSSVFALALCTMLSLLSFSCQTIKDVFGTPSISLESLGIKSLDLEGITFNCNYAITNPYPIGISIKEVAADVLCDTKTFTKLSADKGVSIAASGKKTNSLDFKIPYTSILDFAKSISGKSSLPFSINGSAALDLSAMTGLSFNDLTLPFSKNFNVPIIKPEFSFSDVKIQLPTFESLTQSLVNGGISVAKATQIATALTTGEKISANIFDGIDLNLDLLCNLNVKNSGSSAWNFLVKNCSLVSNGNALAVVKPTGTSSISSSSGTVPLKATLNTLKAGAFIAQIINKSGTNPVIALESGLSFPGLSYASDIPLSYSFEIPISKIGVGK